MLSGLFKQHKSIKMAGAAVALAAVVAGTSLAVSLDGGKVEAASPHAAKAKNVIVMISDGCGYNHIKATDYYAGKKQAYEMFPVSLGMSTYEYEDTTVKIAPFSTTKNLLGYDAVLNWKDFSYSAFPLSTDSASAATAMASGVKTANGYIGMDVAGNPVKYVTQRAEELGKSTGVITTVEWSHATPAGFVAHNTSRNNYAAIAQEMITNSGTDVIMGAGNPDFDDSGAPASPAKDAKYVGGSALWANLKAGGFAPNDANGDGTNDAWTLIQSKADFEALTTGLTPARVCGTAQAYTTTQQARSGDNQAAPYVVPLTSNVPSLATMTKGALNVLDNNKKGFFLMIEGGAIDWAAHANQTGRLIEEEQDFNGAVDAVIAWVNKYSNWNDTLLIVTGDHETGYLWGPGSGTVNGKAVYKPIVNNGKGNVPGVQWGSVEHTNQLIPLYAKGAAAYALGFYATGKDPVRGAFIDNTNIADLVFASMK